MNLVPNSPFFGRSIELVLCRSFGFVFVLHYLNLTEKEPCPAEAESLGQARVQAVAIDLNSVTDVL